jgi:NAD(P)-dependent dehydrogenase (short-subunit alcohol dehydrogenase family)
MDLELAGKVAWVTGGSSGIGLAIARVLADEGCKVAISARAESRLEAAASELGALPVRADVLAYKDAGAAAERIASELGSLDILVNNAAKPGGRVTYGPLEDVDPARLLEDVDEKYGGYFRCAQAAVPFMKARGFGRLVHVGGVTARESGTYGAGARNIAIVHLSKTLADELGPFGITSNVVHPSATVTPWFGVGLARTAAAQGITEEEAYQRRADTHAIRRIVDASEVGYAVAFLASPKGGSITGESIATGGGPQRGVTI